MSRRPRPKIVRLKQTKADPVMTDTLVFLLDRVRAGRVKAYSICLLVEAEDGSVSALETATAGSDDIMELELLGLMRGAEFNFWKRREERRTDDQ